MLLPDETLPPAPAVCLDESQQAVLDRDVAESFAVLGAPGSGKTTALVEFVADRVARHNMHPDNIVVLTASRSAATHLRDRLAVRLQRPLSCSMARTVNSFAFEIVRENAMSQGLESPVLLTGSEQDHMIAELLRGEEFDGGELRWPTEFTTVVRQTRGFRTELRDVMMRCVEWGISAAQLRALGEKTERPEWTAAAAFMASYDAVKASYRDTCYDSSELVAAATNIVFTRGVPNEFAACATFAKIKLLVIDDAQEAGQSTAHLIRAFSRRGANVVAFGDPDIATGSFRGARPDVLTRLSTILGRETARSCVLTGSHRNTEPIRQVVAATTERIGTAGAGTHRVRTHTAASDNVRLPENERDGVRVVVGQSVMQELSSIAQYLRERHVLDGVPWYEMAVITRTGSAIPRVARTLNALDIPTTTSTLTEPVAENTLVQAFLCVTEYALGLAPMSAKLAATIVTGPLGDIDALGFRRLRAALRHNEFASGGQRTADELLVEALREGHYFSLIPTAEAQRAGAVAEMLARLRQRAQDNATIEELFWDVWEHSGVSERFRMVLRESGPTADRAHSDVDAVVSLFTAARRCVERTPDTSPAVFLEQLRASDIPEDTLAAHASRPAVTIATPPAMVGSERDVVVIAGVQEGVWPNLRLRGSLLGSTEIADAFHSVDTSLIDRRTEVLHDELRLFAQAASRARRSLLITAVSNDDEAPSPFFRFLPEPRSDGFVVPLSLRRITGVLRRELTTHLIEAGTSSDFRARAAGVSLKRLARAGVTGADPAEWYGIADPSSLEPLRDVSRGDVVAVSPSKIAQHEMCPLNGVIGDLAGSRASLQSGLGRLIHDACENAAPSFDDLWHAVEQRWNELPHETLWQSQADQERARSMVSRLAQYLSDVEKNGGVLACAETSFELPLRLDDGTAVLRGTIDRLEQYPETGFVIVDLKTGKNDPVTDAGVADHPQLAAYQLAFFEGAIPQANPTAQFFGARLVIISGTTKKPYSAPHQAVMTIDEREAFRSRARAVAQSLTSNSVTAHVSAHCHDSWSFGQCAIHLVGDVSS